MHEHIIIMEPVEGRLQPSAYELISFVQRLFPEGDRDILLALPGADTYDLALDISEAFAIDVVAIEDPRLLYPNPDLVARIVSDIVAKNNAKTVCLHHSPRGCQIAAQISEAVGASCISGVESIAHQDGKVRFTRSILNGQVMTRVVPLRDRVALTVMPGAFPQPARADDTSPGRVEKRDGAYRNALFFPKGLVKSEKDTASLAEADVIISAGRGIEKEETLSLIRAVAGMFQNAAIGATRSLCDMRWLPYAHQIGSTGKTVSPKLYMACGISGAHQHIMGIRDAQLIVAVNKNPNAAIFCHAHYGIVEDLNAFLPLFLEKYKKKYHS
ncbi:MAG: electron transfer flavoprotein subunit alpha/FixB family protein [Myxococcota bacterium]|nr:electron transfer flavoprotein subunit alpha/FixB family protein [Myxococcota bacterium]